MSASTVPPERDDDALSIEELILELSECPLAAETVDVSRDEEVDEIIMMCRAYIVSERGRALAAHLYNRRRH